MAGNEHHQRPAAATPQDGAGAVGAVHTGGHRGPCIQEETDDAGERLHQEEPRRQRPQHRDDCRGSGCQQVAPPSQDKGIDGHDAT